MARFIAVALLFASFALLPFRVFAQVEQVGSSETLEIATWNIEWFGEDNNGPVNEDLQLQNAASVIRDSGIDLWALQEIADEDYFDALRSELGSDWGSVLATISSGQATAFLYDTRTVSLRNSTQILTNFNHEFASRPPLKTEFGISLPDTSFVLTAVNVHMKAFANVESWERRVEASLRVKSHLDFLHADDTVIFIGDFNDELEGSTLSGRESPYKNFVDDSDNYFPVTLELERSGVYSFCDSSQCTAGSSIDHMIVSSEFLPLLAFAGTDRLSSALTINGFTQNTSDHLPIYAVFRDYIDTSTESSNDLPGGFALYGAYPNPFHSVLTAAVDLHEPTDVRVELVDALGRGVASRFAGILPAGEHRLELSPGNVPAGVYFLRISTPESSLVRPVLKAVRR